jgi:hypothetical protein
VLAIISTRTFHVKRYELNIHIDRGEGAVGDGAADGTRESEPGVQVQALGLLFQNSSHCDECARRNTENGKKKRQESGVGSEVGVEAGDREDDRE